MANRPDQLLLALYTDFKAWALAQKGEVLLAATTSQLIEMIQQPAAGFRGILWWGGDDNAATNVRAGNVVNNRIRLVLTGDLGLHADPGKALVTGSGPRAAFLQAVSLCRQRMLAYRWGELAAPNNRLVYQGTSDFLDLGDGLRVAAYVLNFTIFTTMETPSAEVVLT